MPTGITANQLIVDTLRGCGAIGSGEVPTADELLDGLRMFNDVLEMFNTSNLAVYSTADVTFSTVAGQAIYTIGPTGQWVTDRPVRINAAPFCRVGGVDFPIEIIGQADYDLISLKTQPGQIIERLLYVNGVGNGTITLWPVPNAVVSITLAPDTILAAVASLATTLNFPPGYMLTFKHALGILMAPDYGTELPPGWIDTARTSMASIKRANKSKRTAKFDSMLSGDGPVSWQRGY